jgi:hypothetical protein
MTNAARLVAVCVAVAVVIGPVGLRAEQEKPASSGVSVTVKYTGKGTVDATRQLWVWLFDTPEIGPGSIPIAEQSIQKNGGTATFSSVSAKQVYVAVAYDEAGGFLGSAPPPPGSPIALYGSTAPDSPPSPITPGPKGAVTIAFNDAQRMQ